MTKKLLLIYLLLPLYGNIFSQENKAKIIFNINRENPAVFIDEQILPGDSNTVFLRKGSYSVLVKENRDQWDCQSITDTINVVSNDTTYYLDYSFNSRVYIYSDPPDAKVVLSGNKLLGYTPIWISDRQDTLLLLKDQYALTKILSKNIKLKKISLQYTGNGEEDNFIKSPWFKVLLGTSIALGSVAAYYKIKADKFYDDYTAAKDPALLDKVNKYDLYSGIALGALQVNFGVIIYKLLIE